MLSSIPATFPIQYPSIFRELPKEELSDVPEYPPTKELTTVHLRGSVITSLPRVRGRVTIGMSEADEVGLLMLLDE